MALVAFVGYTHWQRGGRGNVGSVVTSTKIAVMKLPVLGTTFKKAFRGGGRSYAYGKKANRRHRYSRRHGRRRRR